MSHALPYLKSRQKRTTHLTLRYTFVQLVQAPLEQHSREYTWQIGGPPSPTTYYHISLLQLRLIEICTKQRYRLLGKTKVSKFQLSSRFSWGVEQVFRLQVSEVEMILQIVVLLFVFAFLLLKSYDIDGNLCAIFISWRYFTAWQISFIIKAASFSVKASWSGFSSKKIGPSSCKLVQG